ncbi:MAG: hypothetical protein JSS07_07305 [Proteobacteria bacterium]|nr:hypothetical protein [Pseudomonadota bacterium]
MFAVIYRFKLKAHQETIYQQYWHKIATYSTQQYGNYELAWKTQDMSFLMIIRAAPWISYDWAMNLCQKMIAEVL